METKNEKLVPFRATHPGEVLKQELEARGIKQNAFAKLIGMQPTHLSELIKGKRNMSETIATKIESGLGIPSAAWMRMHYLYLSDSAAIKVRDCAEQDALEYIAKCTNVNIKVILKRLGLQDLLVREQVKRLGEIFDGIDLRGSLSELQATAGMYKHSEKLQCDDVQMNTWLLLNYAATKDLKAEQPYYKGNALEAATGIAAMANKGTLTEEKMKNALAGAGIAYIVVPKVERAPIDAYSTIKDGQPIITTTHRHDDLDKLVFDVLHELCHITSHITSDGQAFLSIDGVDYSKDPKEREANAFARDTLIPAKIWKAITGVPCKTIDAYKIVGTIVRRARDCGISTSIAVARYKHDTGWYRVQGYRSPKIR